MKQSLARHSFHISDVGSKVITKNCERGGGRAWRRGYRFSVNFSILSVFQPILICTYVVAPVDYVSFNASLMFAACEIRRCVNVSIVNDFAGEPEESFFYKLRRTPGLHPRITLDPVDGEIVIVG